MIMKCLIIDDEPIACRGMKEYVSQIEFLELAGVYADPLQAYQVLDSGEIDLIFLDIEMPRLSGIDFIKSLKKVPAIIFTTAYTSYAVEGFELGVADYLLKPISFPRFLKAVNKVKELHSALRPAPASQPEEKGSFFIKENGMFVKIYYDEVLYAEALQNYVAIHLPGKRLITYITLSILEKQLPESIFMKVHKSYIVSLQKIKAVEGNTILIESTQIPVSRNMKDILMQKVVDTKLLKR
ncbi:MAG: response regulator transcription factor [Chitinophagaceae bacterium]|nr:MAG: response regulator transcription factor [Chitinophagaceae bacterium]